MQIHISGKGVDVGESLRSHMETRLEQGISKYLDRVTSVHAVVSKESHMFRVDISGNLGTHAGLVVRSTGMSADPHAAFDESLEKAEKQLRRYKRKITNHHKNNVSEKTFSTAAKKYVLSPDAGESEESTAGLVIAEKPTAVETLTVSEAVMRMDLSDLPALMFFNAAHGRLNVVYRRVDGNISWVDPEGKAA